MNLHIRQGAHLSDAVDQLMVVEPEFPQLAELPEGAGQVVWSQLGLFGAIWCYLSSFAVIWDDPNATYLLHILYIPLHIL